MAQSRSQERRIAAQLGEDLGNPINIPLDLSDIFDENGPTEEEVNAEIAAIEKEIMAEPAVNNRHSEAWKMLI